MQLFVTFNIRHFGFNSILVRSASYLAFLTTLASLYALVRQFKSASLAPLISLIWFAALPIKTQALFRPGRPENFVTAFCLLAVICQQKVWNGKTSLHGRVFWLFASVSLAFGATLWAETGVSAFLVLGVWTVPSVLVAFGNSDGECVSPLRTILRRMLVPIVGLGGYLIGYWCVGAPFHASPTVDARYELQFGFGVLRNVALALVGVFSPVATPTVARVASHSAMIQDWLVLIGATISLGTLVGVIVRFLRLERNASVAVAVFFCSALTSFFPFVLVGHVSEVYLVQAAAFMSGGVGILAATAIERVSRRVFRVFVAAATVLVSVMLLSSVDAFVLLRHNANVFSVLYGELVRCREVDKSDSVVLIPPCTPSLRFSQYYLGYERIFPYQDSAIPIVTWLPDCNAKPEPSKSTTNVYEVDLGGQIHAYGFR
jgi:hypothetical protein